ncbi:NAD(P)/FAD-dependent oxidoreductase [Tenacibaculum finnmarkense]|uniref:Aminoacetone oxidase family FAD-binding enzyme n=1 Tax=Tenacibaculum finnmarkense genomovar finnmarkense TaxID=1458503 RepID=A0AAP1REB7_9FLAO|nr:NAD(P)/FAD-dependent oxidoreductase [Tenacibaculum finnmarkense]MBE7651992.1 aminoacetone oxidase family FAD-binding enzyme [Tenacibaculum finnmarkense genomovar finnmarkense]MBE7694293.1 aminoacetone oxidase family FAD-binding enzyme [Tenacibaculum finnmarkense genomovar finnmarkense]MCG8730001.1 NAD(P)/FAD-dependent oxidoreductase [Tenacibaculum finnmarkense]MCG8752059.1 NAD(P)/FAD-dependent oxidoreductase [Tenacibaculum finnmarkense]MCG8769032.1 NAD(P)/FAD-dependent oxidoreductase [Tenac
MKKVIIIGGGAAGHFTAINAKEQNPDLDITILEKGKEVLQKVKISGGGRCNVTHACFEPKELVKFYPRGEKELLGPFHQFMTGDTFEWFDDRGVPLKIEDDNRVFPEENTSQVIIDCFQNAVDKLGIKVLKNHGVNSIEKNNEQWIINTKEQQFKADYLVIAAGSSKKVWDLCKTLEHTVVEPVPSLFTFNIKDKRIIDLGGISVPNADVKLVGTNLENSGPLLITHWGLSGPAILKLSAFGARILADKNYQYNVLVNWLGQDFDDVLDTLTALKKSEARKQIHLKSPFADIPRRLWERFVSASEVKTTQNWGDLSNKQLENLATQLTKGLFNANGRTTFKDEFVTAGGVDLKEINFKRFESKLHKNLFMVGEVLNIDAVTGGFNFQNAWTGAYICAKSISE